MMTVGKRNGNYVPLRHHGGKIVKTATARDRPALPKDVKGRVHLANRNVKTDRVRPDHRKVVDPVNHIRKAAPANVRRDRFRKSWKSWRMPCVNWMSVDRKACGKSKRSSCISCVPFMARAGLAARW